MPHPRHAPQSGAAELSSAIKHHLWTRVIVCTSTKRTTLQILRCLCEAFGAMVRRSPSPEEGFFGAALLCSIEGFGMSPACLILRAGLSVCC